MSLPVAFAMTHQSQTPITDLLSLADSLDALTSVAQAALIAVGARYIGTTIPLCMLLVWVIQKLYLRTSRQLRLLDLETKSPLYTHILETMDGLTTIRVFGWQSAFVQKNHDLLDASQKSFYLLYCIQRWLNLVLDLLVAGLAVVLMYGGGINFTYKR